MHQTQLQVRLSLGGLNGYAEPKYVEDRVSVRITQVRNPSIPHHHFSFLFSMNEVWENRVTASTVERKNAATA
jgi:hypothetical protein